MKAAAFAGLLVCGACAFREDPSMESDGGPVQEGVDSELNELTRSFTQANALDRARETRQGTRLGDAARGDHQTEQREANFHDSFLADLDKDLQNAARHSSDTQKHQPALATAAPAASSSYNRPVHKQPSLAKQWAESDYEAHLAALKRNHKEKMAEMGVDMKQAPATHLDEFIPMKKHAIKHEKKHAAVRTKSLTNHHDATPGSSQKHGPHHSASSPHHGPHHGPHHSAEKSSATSKIAAKLSAARAALREVEASYYQGGDNKHQAATHHPDLMESDGSSTNSERVARQVQDKWAVFDHAMDNIVDTAAPHAMDNIVDTAAPQARRASRHRRLGESLAARHRRAKKKKKQHSRLRTTHHGESHKPHHVAKAEAWLAQRRHARHHQSVHRLSHTARHSSLHSQHNVRQHKASAKRPRRPTPSLQLRRKAAARRAAKAKSTVTAASKPTGMGNGMDRADVAASQVLGEARSTPRTTTYEYKELHEQLHGPFAGLRQKSVAGSIQLRLHAARKKRRAIAAMGVQRA